MDRESSPVSAVLPLTPLKYSSHISVPLEDLTVVVQFACQMSLVACQGSREENIPPYPQQEHPRWCLVPNLYHPPTRKPSMLCSAVPNLSMLGSDS